MSFSNTDPWCCSWRFHDQHGRAKNHNHREWCMTKSQPSGEARYRDSIKTACGYYVHATGGLERRQPTCPECLAILQKCIGEELLEAEQKAAMWLYRGNKAKERGDHSLAERHYDRAQRWHDKMILLEESTFGQ